MVDSAGGETGGCSELCDGDACIAFSRAVSFSVRPSVMVLETSFCGFNVSETSFCVDCRASEREDNSFFQLVIFSE